MRTSFTAEVGRRGVVISTLEEATPTRQAFYLLLIGLVVSVIALGADKLFHVFADWNACIAPQVLARVPTVPPHRIMLGAGAIEVLLALFTLLRPRGGALLLALALSLMVANLVLARRDLAMAFLDAVLIVIALAVSRMATAYARVTSLDG